MIQQDWLDNVAEQAYHVIMESPTTTDNLFGDLHLSELHIGMIFVVM